MSECHSWTTSDISKNLATLPKCSWTYSRDRSFTRTHLNSPIIGVTFSVKQWSPVEDSTISLIAERARQDEDEFNKDPNPQASDCEEHGYASSILAHIEAVDTQETEE